MAPCTFRMTVTRAPAAAALLLIAVSLLPERAAAQEQPPARIGNRWDSLSHQPTQGQVGAAEQERGLAPDAEHEHAIDNELERLDQQLLNAEQNHPPRHVR